MSPAWLHHGGALAAARARFGDGDWLDLSTGISPLPWPGVAGVAVDWRRLPEADALAGLEAAAAAAFGADPALTCAVPGSEIGLRLVGSLLNGPAAYAAPGYGTHAEALAGARPVPADDLRAADGTTLLLANPSNPDGAARPADELAALLGARGPGWLLVDEAFVEVTDAPSMAPLVREGRRLAVFRSFGKVFGLGGVRLGFVVAPPALIAPLRARLGAWPLSAAAIAIGTAAYRDGAWLAAAPARLARLATALDATLAHHGLRARGACPLFRLIEHADATALFERLAGARILTRPFAGRPTALRLGLPAEAAALDRLDRALGGG